MKIAVLGSGHIGAGLARAWVKKGHDVVLGARDAEDVATLERGREIGARVASLADAAKGADVVVLAVPYGALASVIAATGPMEGQVVIDCTNAVEPGFALKFGHTTSSAEELQRRLPRARVVKSFNAQGAENLADPVYGSVPATNFLCGDDDEARAVVSALASDVGFEPMDVGPLRNARLLEPLMVLWIATAKAVGSRDVAFKVLRRS